MRVGPQAAQVRSGPAYGIYLYIITCYVMLYLCIFVKMRCIHIYIYRPERGGDESLPLA